MPRAVDEDINIVGTAPSPSGAAVDRFGLPTDWTLLEDATADPCGAPPRKKAVMDLVKEVFGVAMRHLGEDEARCLFRHVSAGHAGRKPKEALSIRDRELLGIFDARAVGLTPLKLRSLPKQVAKAAAGGQSVEAKEKHLRRLLKQRALLEKQRAAQRQREAEYAAWMLKQFGPTLLEGIPDKNRG